ncbi:MAG: hypothetical protein AMXMBFR53_15200 [Gemmatimonadota bacterium]
MQHVTDCHVEPLEGRASEQERGGAREQILALAGMGCPNCANRIRNTLLRVRGVVDVEVDLPASLATVWYDPTTVQVPTLLDAVSLAGTSTMHRYLAVPLDAR